MVMLKKLGILAVTLMVGLAILTAGCSDDETTIEQVHIKSNDIYGLVEYESDGDYPPPDNLDNVTDDNIVVTLFFGYNEDPYRVNDVYGYAITDDYNDENFSFPFVPEGDYWMTAEFVIQDSCFQKKTSTFYHADTAHTFVELRPAFIGLNKCKYYLEELSPDLAGLAAVSDDNMVQISERCWVTKQVYEDIYKDRMENGELIQP